ncbi:phosphoglyceromutase [Blastocystis sp. subtype 4]|uniref:phosphoglyceromutase n=1 Tax=Blastocystis sp. subtype 4 TaxID=944170 RepID=UPI000711F740|nr:phosphoglyceromutase [Blastocystis sp. subtype 4]KNB42014.1 phosphoglyceromutase [Blastocystis sp. subtype 4]|eukprot:XP_014525457.1 phosphoglyceromutase [Blastocystis sp. subtype 4]
MVQPASLDEDAVLRDGDVMISMMHVLFFNVRTGDTAVLMHTLLFCDTSIPSTEESKKMMESLPFMATVAKPNISVASLVQYDDSSDCPIMVPPLPIQKTFVRVLGEAGKKQLRMSEESRFTHIRFLLNGAGDVSVPGDDAVMVHDKSGEHTRETIAIANMISNALQTGYYDVITTMLSAAGIAASSKSVELTADMCGQVDRVVKRIAEEAEKDGYSVVIVGTHSEATHVPEKDDERGPCNNVPCFIRPCEGVTFEKQECKVDGKMRA